jgi:hypothetical protein
MGLPRATLLLAVVLALALPAGAGASTLIDRNASGVTLQVDARGRALLTYRAAGKVRHVLAWGAVNALPPTAGRRQVDFRLDYSGGWGSERRDVWKTFANTCRPYTGPALAWMVTACTAPDGSHWAIQSWQRMLPNYGLGPTPKQAAWELHLSHWTGPLAVLTVNANWAYRTYDHIFGTFTYRGRPVHGFASTAQGNPLDAYGRNLYVDTLDSAYGTGWKRENSFLMHVGTGDFCYGFYPHGNRPVGKGTQYRATIIGPGVTPDVMWRGTPLGPYDATLDRQLADVQREVYGADRLCKPV